MLSHPAGSDRHARRHDQDRALRVLQHPMSSAAQEKLVHGSVAMRTEHDKVRLVVLGSVENLLCYGPIRWLNNGTRPGERRG